MFNRGNSKDSSELAPMTSAPGAGPILRKPSSLLR